MTHPATHEHDLEDHIPMLRELDVARKRSAQLRDEGIEVLMESLRLPEKKEELPPFGDWLYETPLIIRALLTRHDQPLGKDKEKTRLKLIKSLAEWFQEDKLTLEKLAENELSVLAAANILRTLTAQPGAAFSKTAMLCYYWIVRELYTADRSDWNIGGARAAPGGLVTAFATGECVRALLSFADALRNTGEFIAEAGNYLERSKHLKNLSITYFATKKPLKNWVEAEEKRLLLSYSLKLQSLSRYRVLSLIITDQAKNKVNPDINMEDYLEKINHGNFGTALISEIEEKGGKFEEALRQIRAYRSFEHVKTPNVIADAHEYFHGEPPLEISKLSAFQGQRLNDVTRSESAHMFACIAVEHALDRVKKAKELFKKKNKAIFDEKRSKKIKREFDEAAHEVDKLLHPARHYLSSVLDRELTLVSLGETWDWQPCELACAAASYGKLTKEWGKDSRFGRAVKDLSKMVSSRGRFANPRHFHEQPDGLRYLTENAVILRAMAQLLHHAYDSEIETGLAENLLRFFEDTRATQTLKAWSFNATDITPDLIHKLANDPKAKHICETFPKEMGALLTLASSYLKSDVKSDKNLPKAFSEPLAKGLAKGINEWIQAFPFDGIEDFKKEIEWTEEQIGRKIGRKKEDICLLKWVCLRRAFLTLEASDVEQAVKQALSDKKGWVWEFSQPPFKTDLAATASAVMALAKINEMLDAHINHIVLEHFSVKKKNKGLDAKLTLDSLFYPDYGLLKAPNAKKLGIGPSQSNIDKDDWPENGCWRKKSIAITLQQMRSHVSRLLLLQEESLYSLVLHGPAGTGKSTLVEALAVTCDVPLVEVTPSDLVKHGEENLEQRARAVFEALSMLTRVVILFDEFDPVLKRRIAVKDKPLSVFSFLTPGMLPKLKDLHDGAKKRSVVYVLVTNLIGELDEAAVRQGRFDERVGIYPPDLLSRVGRFLDTFTPKYKQKVKKYSGLSLPGIEVLSAPGSASGEGTLLFTKGKNGLTWTPCGGEPSKLKLIDAEEGDSREYELRGRNKDSTTGWLLIKRTQSELPTQDCSRKITISNPSPDSAESSISNNLCWSNLSDVINATAGKGMTTLGKPGWFTFPSEVTAKTPFGYILGMERFDDPEPDDKLKNRRGEGRTAVTECLQWMWINALDKKLHEDATVSELLDVLKERPLSLDPGPLKLPKEPRPPEK